MGYLIQYEPELNHKYRIKGKWRPDKRFMFWGCICAAMVVLAVIPAVRQWVLEFLIPGDAQVTTSAFSQFVSDLRSGEQLSDAVTTFCQEILAHA